MATSGVATEDDERMVIPDLVLFVNGIPLVVMEAKSPSLLEVWKSQAVRQLRRYQEAGPEWQGRAAHRSCSTTICFAWPHCGAAAAYAGLGAPENTYFKWKSVLPYVRRMRCACASASSLRGRRDSSVGLLSPATLLDDSSRLRGLRAGAGTSGQEACHATSSTARFALPWSDCSPAVSRRNEAE